MGVVLGVRLWEHEAAELAHLGALGAPRRPHDVEGRGELRGRLPVPPKHRRVFSGVDRMDPARGQEEGLTSKRGDVGVWGVRCEVCAPR